MIVFYNSFNLKNRNNCIKLNFGLIDLDRNYCYNNEKNIYIV